jgi:hypothetical protein
MNAPSGFPLYAVTDRSQDGRRLRILATFREPRDAHTAADLLRWSGGTVDVVLMTQVSDAE